MPLAEGLRETLRDWFAALVFRGHALIAGWLQLDAARGWWADRQSGARDCHRFLWSLVVWESRAQRFPADDGCGGPAL